jgi:hypothetical protein
LLVGGPSGAGKSTTREALLGIIEEVVALDSDVLWREDQGREEFFRLWLRLAAEIGRSSRPVALFGAGFAVPDNIEPLRERAAFSRVHYLALVCDDEVLAARIRARARPRRTDDPHVAEHVQFNRWLRANASKTRPPVELFDTSECSVNATATAVGAWVRRCLTE